MPSFIQNAVTLQTEFGPNVYFIVIDDNSLFYNGSSFEEYSESHWISYGINMPLIGANIYQGTFPSLALGTYTIYAYAYSSVPNTTDQIVGYGTCVWNGSTEVTTLTDTTVFEMDTGIDAALGTISTSVQEDPSASAILSGIDDIDSEATICTGTQSLSDIAIEIGSELINVGAIDFGVE